MSEGHVPVLLNEVLEALNPIDGALYIDGTFGGGGYTRAILDRANCRVVAIDRDPDAIARGRALQEKYGERLTLVEGNFAEMDNVVGVGESDGVVLDLGVSSFQLDQPARGFSFREDGPLDMRMSAKGMSAADLVNEADEKTLADIIFQLGEERHSRRVARAIVAARPLSSTRALADVVARALGPGALRHPIHPATRTFQAIRIHVNDELGELERGLVAAERVLKAGGRLAVVAFHSLEDRIVKRFLTERTGAAPKASRHAPLASAGAAPTFRLVWPGTRTASYEEAERNPRARSARIRAAERTAAAA